MKSMREFYIELPGHKRIYMWAENEEAALDKISLHLFEVEGELPPMTRQEYLENEADNQRKDCA